MRSSTSRPTESRPDGGATERTRRPQGGAAERYLSLDDSALAKQCDVEHRRDRGPGGTRQNKTLSAVRLRHRPTGLVVTASERRSQHVNMAAALRRLREAIALHVRTAADIDTYSPSELLASCITPDGRLSVGRRNQRYYAALCEIFDVLAACGLRVSDAAGRVGVTTANLSKFLGRDPKALVRVNEMRSAAGLRRLS